MVSKVVAVVSVILLGVAASIQAQAPAQDYTKLSEITREQLPATPLVYAAYGFVWVALVVYVFMLWRRIGRVERELADVNAKLGSRR